MNKVIEEFVPWIELLEGVIYDDTESPNEFEKTFCDGNELLNVWFSSETILVEFLLSSGQAVMNSYNLSALDSWLGDNDLEVEDD